MATSCPDTGSFNTLHGKYSYSNLYIHAVKHTYSQSNRHLLSITEQVSSWRSTYHDLHDDGVHTHNVLENRPVGKASMPEK